MSLKSRKAISAIENLIAGEGRRDLLELEKMTNVFCPFDAIGMSRQEIRHGRFLEYVLSPKSPHGLGDLVARAFFMVLARNNRVESISVLDISLGSFDDIIVRREWRSIDLLLEIPAGALGRKKSGVVAIELKIGAGEHGSQLKNYQHIVEQHYPSEKWDKTYVLMSPEGNEPSREEWIPVELGAFADEVDTNLSESGLSSRGAHLLKDYLNMLRREVLANEDIANLAKRIWANHKDALETLFDHWPDTRTEELWEYLCENTEALADGLSESSGTPWTVDKCDNNYLRFRPQKWEDIEGYESGQKGWSENGALILLEVYMHHAVMAKFVLGPGHAETRVAIYDEFLKMVDKGNVTISRRFKDPGKSHRSLGVRTLMSREAVEDSKGEKLDAVMDIIIERLSDFVDAEMKGHTQALKKALRNA